MQLLLRRYRPSHHKIRASLQTCSETRPTRTRLLHAIRRVSPISFISFNSVRLPDAPAHVNPPSPSRPVSRPVCLPLRRRHSASLQPCCSVVTTAFLPLTQRGYQPPHRRALAPGCDSYKRAPNDLEWLALFALLSTAPFREVRSLPNELSTTCGVTIPRHMSWMKWRRCLPRRCLTVANAADLFSFRRYPKPNQVPCRQLSARSARLKFCCCQRLGVCWVLHPPCGYGPSATPIAHCL